MPPKKGKERTKGLKQIIEENIATIEFYRNMILGAYVINSVSNAIFGELFSTNNILLLLLASVVYGGSYHFLLFMSKPTFSDALVILDSGVDLNMEGGIAEHVKDLIILTSIIQVFASLSNYFWIFWLLAPARGIWLLWKNVLSPYFFQQAPAPEVDEKKQRKLERKMRRH